MICYYLSMASPICKLVGSILWGTTFWLFCTLLLENYLKSSRLLVSCPNLGRTLTTVSAVMCMISSQPLVTTNVFVNALKHAYHLCSVALRNVYKVPRDMKWRQQSLQHLPNSSSHLSTLTPNSPTTSNQVISYQSTSHSVSDILYRIWHPL